MENELQERLKKIKVEDFIWLIYLVIIGISFYNNRVEENFLISNNKIIKDKYRSTQILIFSIAFIIYVYFFIDGYNDLKNLKKSDSAEKSKFTYLNFLASFAITVAGAILLYIAIEDVNVETEIAFN